MREKIASLVRIKNFVIIIFNVIIDDHLIESDIVKPKKISCARMSSNLDLNCEIIAVIIVSPKESFMAMRTIL